MKNETKNIARIMIAGTHSGVGKTSIATGLMALLSLKGYQVQPFKVGPDYIDPSYHTAATGNISRNLDVWMVGEEMVKELFHKKAVSADISVIEGVMGLFDGHANSAHNGSSAHVAKLTKTPVILIVDAKSMAQSVAALIKGFMEFDKDLNLAGVIINRVGSDRHIEILKESIEDVLNIPILGFIRNGALPGLPSRHLGLVPAAEGNDLDDKIKSLATALEGCLDLNEITKIAQGTIGFEDASTTNDFADSCLCNEKIVLENKPRIAIARDHIFSFYYQDSLDILESCGGELVPFSPALDQDLPENISGILIGGGFPELYLQELQANHVLKQKIHEAGRSGMPIYAECGGLMYLCQRIRDFSGNAFDMVGLVPAEARMQSKRVGLGYVEAKLLHKNILAEKDSVNYPIRGHEFHYSELVPFNLATFQNAYNLKGNKYKDGFPEGWVSTNILASYVHLHFAGNRKLAQNFVQHCKTYMFKQKDLLNT